MFNLDKALAAWRRPFRFHRGFEKADIDELERHIRDQVHFLVEQGATEETAFHQAIREMGGMVEAEREYQKVYFLRLKHNQTLLHEILFYRAMLKNYITIAYRNLLKNKTASFINLFGLSVAIGCSIVVFVYVSSTLSRNSAHEHADEVFLVQHTFVAEDGVQTWGNSPVPLGPRMADEIPQVKRAVRFADGGAEVQTETDTFSGWVRFADAGFFDVFTFPLMYGDAGALHDPDAIILSATAATKYFGQQNPMGEQLTLTFDNQVTETFTVRGVAQPFPLPSGIQFHLLLSYDVQRRLGNDLDNWAAFTAATFIQVDNPADILTVASQMDGYRTLQRSAHVEHPIEAFVFGNLKDLPRTNADVHHAVGGFVSWAPVIVLSIIAIFLLTLACFNYMNIALAAATRRLRELGVRKAVGGTKGQLVVQFLTENVLLCGLALGLGIVFAQFVVLPGFNSIANANFTLPFAESLGAWLFLLGLLVFVGLASGAYPAFYVAALSPIGILRGTPVSGGRKRFMQAFLTIQFVLAFITMITSIMLVLNGQHQASQDWGYNEEHVLTIDLRTSDAYTSLYNAAVALPAVTHRSGALHHIGRESSRTDVIVDGEPVTVVQFDVGPQYTETLGIRLKTGRLLVEGDAQQAIVVNETFVSQQGWTDETALGQLVRQDSLMYTVAGIVHDFHYSGFFDLIRPTFFRLANEVDYRYLALRVQPGSARQTAEAMEAAWTQYAPDTAFEFFFQDAVFDGYYRESQGLTNIFIFTAVMALLISCMGLFGLAAQNVASRMKEVSIRKVLGASVLHVTRLTNQRFFVLLAIAAVLASPLSYVIVTALMESMYSYYLPVGLSPFLIAYVLVFFTALLTVSTQIRRVITVNPAQELRSE